MRPATSGGDQLPSLNRAPDGLGRKPGCVRKLSDGARERWRVRVLWDDKPAQHAQCLGIITNRFDKRKGERGSVGHVGRPHFAHLRSPSSSVKTSLPPHDGQLPEGSSPGVEPLRPAFSASVPTL